MTNLPITNQGDVFNSVCNADKTIKEIYRLKEIVDQSRAKAQEERAEALKSQKSHKKRRVLLPILLPIPITIIVIQFVIITLALLSDIPGLPFLRNVADSFFDLLENKTLETLLLIVGIIALAILIIMFVVPCSDKYYLEKAESLELEAKDRKSTRLNSSHVT